MEIGNRRRVASAFAGVLLAAMAWTVPSHAHQSGEAGPDLRPWGEGGGNPAVVFFIASHAEDTEFGTNTAFHVGGGLFVTCVHAFESYEKFEVLTATGSRSRVGRIAAFDRARDVAVFTVDPPLEGLAAIELADGAAAPGTMTSTVGFPGNAYREMAAPVLGQWPVAGWGELLALDGIAEAGASGGPVLDGKGRALGMIFRSSFGKGAGHEVGPLTYSVASTDIVRLLGTARAALKAGPDATGPLSIGEWVRKGRDAWSPLPHIVHRSLWKKDFDGAAKAIRKRLAANPKEARTWALYSEVFRAQGDLESAARAVDSALEAEPGDCRALFELGEIKEHKGETASAIAAYEQCALGRRPGMDFNDLMLVSDAHCKRAYLLDAAGRREEAVQAYRAALAIGPYLSCEHWRLGDVLCLLDRPSEGIAAFRRSLALRPGQPLVLLRLAIAQSAGAESGAALESARAAVAMDGKSPVARFLLGYLAWREGWKDEARAQVAPLVELDRDLAARLSAHLDGREDRPPGFTFSMGGGLKVKPLPTR